MHEEILRCFIFLSFRSCLCYSRVESTACDIHIIFFNKYSIKIFFINRINFSWSLLSKTRLNSDSGSSNPSRISALMMPF